MESTKLEVKQPEELTKEDLQKTLILFSRITVSGNEVDDFYELREKIKRLINEK